MACDKMTTDQERHLARVNERLRQLTEVAYRAGQSEHGGDLWRKRNQVREALGEVVDLGVYLVPLEEQISEARGIAIEALEGDGDAHEALSSILDLL